MAKKITSPIHLVPINLIFFRSLLWRWRPRPPSSSPRPITVAMSSRSCKILSFQNEHKTMDLLCTGLKKRLTTTLSVVSPKNTTMMSTPVLRMTALTDTVSLMALSTTQTAMTETSTTTTPQMTAQTSMKRRASV